MQKEKLVYFGQLTAPVNLKSISPTIVVQASNIKPDLSSQGMFNGLKYRKKLEYLGQEYKEITVPCVPGHQHILKSNEQKSSLKHCYVKVNEKTETIGLGSGKRSAILVQQGQAIRFKGCGNQLKGFNKENNQSRGHHFWHTAKRQLFMNQYINSILKQQLKINVPANNPIALFNYPDQEIYKLGLANDLPKIGKYCCVFQTQGDRRAGTHLISPLQVIFLAFANHQTADWLSIFQQKERINQNEPIQFVKNWQLFMEEGKQFLQIYERSAPISNYIILEQNKKLSVEIIEQKLQKIISKLVTKQYQQTAFELLKKVKNADQIIGIILKKIGWEMGRVKRVLCEKKISWGFFQDHVVQWHCNAHLNNFIVTPPKAINTVEDSHFLLPLDFDLAYLEEQFINIELDSPNYGKNDKNTFQNYLCAEFSSMEMSLFGLQIMNFKYGILEEEQGKTSIEEQMSRIAFRDTLARAFNQGMRNNAQFGEEIIKQWNQNIEEIANLVQGCLYLSDSFQT